MQIRRVILVLALVIVIGCGLALGMQKRPPDAAALQRMIARFAPTDIGADVSALPASEQTTLGKLIEAAKIMDAIFLRQVWAGNEAMLLDLVRRESPLARLQLHYFLINKGPWSSLDANEPFIPGAPPKSEQANFYPPGATKAEIESWLKTLSESDRAEAAGFFTAIRRSGNRFTIVPYSVEYQAELAIAADLLRQAAASTGQPTLKTYLAKRADAFLSNDYYDSDVAWMELDASIEPTIGPYEVYEDEWFNYKAAFEAFITVRDNARSRRSASPTWCSRRATRITRSKPPPSTCRTTSASFARKARSGSC